MAWETVQLKGNALGRNTPSISVGHKRLALNKAACELMETKKRNYRYVQFMEDSKNANIIGIRFWKGNANLHCIPVKEKLIDGKPVGGLEVANANLMRQLFGDTADQTSVKKYRVKKDENHPHVLIVFRS